MNNFVVYPAFFNRSPSKSRINYDHRNFFVILVTANRRPSASKQRQELTSWLLPSERDQRRPFSEQNDFGRNQRTRTGIDECDIFGNRRQHTVTAREERTPVSYYTTSYNQHYNQTSLSREPSNISISSSFSLILFF